MRNFDEAEQELFDKYLNEFISKVNNEDLSGENVLGEIYALHRRLDNTLHLKLFPIRHIYYYLLEKKISAPCSEGGYAGLSIAEIVAKEKGLVREGKVYKILRKILKVRRSNRNN